ncbi:MAG: SIR2 family protein [Caldisericales bacterium]|nr:SIR2 family protein [bacterium]
MGIKPIESLIFAIQSNPGTYALLLGSGISRAANIPTGWEITEDLIRKLAAQKKEECEPDPGAWYLEKFGKEPDYSKLLEELAKTKTERQQLLQSYFEPNSTNNEGDKRPTKAHKAIASLVAKGFIKVIITTNFDRLLENALNEIGIEQPTVISTLDQINSALPLTQNKNCRILKIHGDYQDTRIKNTPSELEKYSNKFNKILNQIFDEYGLIVCGWSAEWDTALCNALSHVKTRRFTTYWAIHGELKKQASELIELRDAQKIQIKDADTFFQEVADGVDAIEKYSKPHPLSTELAVANLKRYLSEPKYDIQLADLVDETVNKIAEAISDENSTLKKLHPSSVDPSSVKMVIDKYGIVCSTLLSMAPIGAFYARREHWHIWQKVLMRMSLKDDFSYSVELENYLKASLFYILGLGAIAGEKLDFLNHLFTTNIHRNIRGNILAIEYLPPLAPLNEHLEEIGFYVDDGCRKTYLNDYFYRILRQYVKQIIPDDRSYEYTFNKFEILIALSFRYNDTNLPNYVPPGRFIYQKEQEKQILDEIRYSLNNYENDSPFVTSRIFGKTLVECIHNLAGFEEIVYNIRESWHIPQ